MSEAPSCGSCRFAKANLGQRMVDDSAAWSDDAPADQKEHYVISAECRRYAPRRGVSSYAWPHVEATDWCGEYQPQPAQPKSDGDAA